MRAKLVGVQGLFEGNDVYLIKDEPLTIGRSETSKIRLYENKVSRNHCQITLDGGFYVVEDLQSKNGTWVNGKRTTRSMLFHCASILVGEETFRFEL